VQARGVVEKPDPAEAPSTLTIIGRYIIQPEVFGHLARGEPGAGGEIQLTDALGKLIDEGQAFHGLRFEGRRFDCGDKLGFLEATVALGLRHPELGPGLRQILNSYL
jgi:UTP--glucose-1-phosphate uridylyltransferase